MTAPDRIFAAMPADGVLKPETVYGWTTAEHIDEWRDENAAEVECGSDYDPLVYVEMIRRDPAALAGDETVQAMIGAVVEEAAAIVRPAQRVKPISARWAFADDILESRYLSIRALRPDATAALAARDKRIRDAALEEAAKVAALAADRFRSQMNGTTLADASYRLAEAEAVDKAVAAIIALKEAQP